MKWKSVCWFGGIVALSAAVSSCSTQPIHIDPKDQFFLEQEQARQKQLIQKHTQSAMRTGKEPALSERKQALEQEMHKRSKLQYSPGFAIAYVRGHDPLQFHCSHQSAGDACTVDEHTLFDIGDVTKLFTAHLTLLLQSEGLLSIDQPIGKYLPDSIKLPGKLSKTITIQQLLTYTSGLKDPSTPASLSQRAWIDYLAHADVVSTFGSRTHYSHVGHVLLGYILEHVSGKDYFTLLQEKILIPLNLKETFLTIPHDYTNRVSGYIWEKETSYSDGTCLSAAGGLKSTASDLATYMQCFFLQEKDAEHNMLYHQMIQTHGKWNTGCSSTLSWGLNELHPHRIYEVIGSGDMLGFRVFMGYEPATKEGLVLLTNSNLMDFVGGHFFNKEEQVFDIYEPARISPVDLCKWEGVYCGKDVNHTVTMTAQNEHLQMRFWEGTELSLYPLGNDLFFIKHFCPSMQLLQFWVDSKDVKKCKFDGDAFSIFTENCVDPAQS